MNTGDKIELQLFGTAVQFPEVLTVKQGSAPNTYHFTVPSSNQNLRSLPNGTLDYNGGTGPFATWVVEYSPTSASCSFYPMAHIGKTNSSGGRNWYLGFKDGKWVGNTGNDESGQFLISKQYSASVFQEPPYVDPLSESQKIDFIRNGYLVIKNVIPKELVEQALRRINHAMGSAAYDTQGEKVEFHEQVRTSSEILAPFMHSNAMNIAKSLLGENNVVTPRTAQIALRFPSFKQDHIKLAWHIDGMKNMLNGQFYPFSLLFGVALSDQSTVGQGNLRVFPGSHYTLAGPYKTAVTRSTPLPQNQIDVGHEEHVLLSPGDIVVVHPLVAHGVGKVTTTRFQGNHVYSQ